MIQGRNLIMNNEWAVLLTEFLVNYWLHSSLFVGAALIALNLGWLNADRRGEIIAKLALFAGLLTSLIFVTDWRVIENNKTPLEISWQLSEKQIDESAAKVSAKAFENENNKSRHPDPKTASALEAPKLSKPNNAIEPSAILAKTESLMDWLKAVQWQFVLLSIWLVIALSIALFKLTKISQLYWLLENRQLVSDPKIIRIYSKLTQKLRVSSSVKLMESEKINSPIVFGQNEIILPVNFSGQFQSQQIEAALAHEIAHLKRKDSHWQRLFLVYSSLFFFQPLNKLLISRLYQIAEQRSDQLAGLWTGNSRALAEALAITAQNHFNASQNQWVPAMKSNKSQLLVRVEALLSTSSRSSSLMSVAFSSLITLFVLTVMPGCSISQVQAKSFLSGSDSRFDISNGKTRRMNMSHSGHGIKIKIKADLQDDLKFNDSDTAIIEFPEDSRLDITFEKNGDDDRRLLIKRKGAGQTEYHFYVDGDKKDYDQSGKQWFASVLPQIFRMTGLDATGRVARIKNKGGDSAVLDEVELIRSDFIQRVYQTELFKLSKLSNADAYRALELSENIQSDFELGGTLKAFVKTQNSSDKIWKKLFKVSQEIQSDFELAGFLKTTISHLPPQDDTQEYFFDAAESVQSDFEMRRLFSNFVTEKDVSEKLILKMLVAAENISSDFELASLLMETNQKAKMSDRIFDAYLKASKGISSDFEMARTFMSLLENKIEKTRLIELMDAAGDHISSDFELARFLIEVIDKQSIDAESKTALLGAADSIGSDFEQNRVFRRLNG